MGNSRASTSGTGNKYGSHAFLFLTTNLTKRGTGAALTSILIMGKNFTKFLSGLCIAILSMLTLSSCTDEESTVQFTLMCSEDVLEYVQPTVTYLDENGKEVSKELTRQDFQTTDPSTKSVEVSSTLPYWSVKMTYDHANVSNTCKVSFKSIKPLAGKKSNYTYMAQLVSTGSYRKDSPTNKTQSSNVGIDLTIPLVMSETVFKDALEDLVSEGLQGGVEIDGDGRLTIE